MPWNPLLEAPVRVVIGPDPASLSPVRTASLNEQAADVFQQAIAAPEAIQINLPAENVDGRRFHPDVLKRYLDLSVDEAKWTSLRSKYSKVAAIVVDSRGQVIGSSSILPSRLRFDEDRVGKAAKSKWPGFIAASSSGKFAVTLGFIAGLNLQDSGSPTNVYRGLFSGYCDQSMTPLAINFQRTMPQFAPAEEGVRLRAGSTGYVRLAWPRSGQNVAWIARDANGDGQIDDLSELFGSATPYSSQAVATNGFVALSAFDLNADNVVDAEEARSAGLLLWFDANADGESSPSELKALPDLISQISLTTEFSDWSDGNGNTAPLRSEAISVDGDRLDIWDFYLGWLEG
jgi:hypothetical protein